MNQTGRKYSAALAIAEATGEPTNRPIRTNIARSTKPAPMMIALRIVGSATGAHYGRIYAQPCCWRCMISTTPAGT
jgi:hypothetical protein